MIARFRLCHRMLFLLLGVLPLLADAQAGHWETGSYGNPYGSRDYRVWVPAGYDGTQALPLLLVLHGCGSDAPTMADLTGFNDLADGDGFFVVYPNQSVLANPLKCWNWSVALGQQRGKGEASILAGIVAQAKASYSIDASRVYVAGFSAGGAMSATLLACYSDVFAAGAVHSGGMYKGALTPVDGLVAMLLGSLYSPEARGRDAWECSGSPAPRKVPVIVFHGSADGVVNPLNGEQVVGQFLQVNDLGDDGLDDDSIGAANPTVYAGVEPGDDGRSYSIAVYAFGGETLVEHWSIEGMGHAWSGGTEGVSGADAGGTSPNASLHIWSFLSGKRR